MGYSISSLVQVSSRWAPPCSSTADMRRMKSAWVYFVVAPLSWGSKERTRSALPASAPLGRLAPGVAVNADGLLALVGPPRSPGVALDLDAAPGARLALA